MTMMGGNMMGGSHWSSGGVFGIFFMLIFWILIIIGVIFIIKWIVDQSSGNQTPATDEKEESALDILNKRYARGEIDKQEFAEKKRDLS